MTRRETFTNLSDVWAKEVDLYSTNQDCVKMLVGNKVDRVSSCVRYFPMSKSNHISISVSRQAKTRVDEHMNFLQFLSPICLIGTRM